jgi:hypothetical protein
MYILVENTICQIVLPCGLRAMYFPAIGEQPNLAVNDDSFKGEVK